MFAHATLQCDHVSALAAATMMTPCRHARYAVLGQAHIPYTGQHCVIRSNTHTQRTLFLLTVCPDGRGCWDAWLHVLQVLANTAHENAARLQVLSCCILGTVVTGKSGASNEQTHGSTELMAALSLTAILAWQAIPTTHTTHNPTSRIACTASVQRSLQPKDTTHCHTLQCYCQPSDLESSTALPASQFPLVTNTTRTQFPLVTNTMS